MGRPREFDPESMIAAAAALFDRNGYEGTSMDRLVQVTGVHRGSIYLSVQDPPDVVDMVNAAIPSKQ